MKHNISRLILSILLLSVVVSCKTKKGETTKLGKFYHNVTGHYNAYYNADLLLMKGFDAQAQSNMDNYNQLLNMFPYTAGAAPAAASTSAPTKANSSGTGIDDPSSKSGTGQSKPSGGNPSGGGGTPLDEAIKKSAINIELHRPSNWADDSYFIVGRAEFLKKEYEKSASTFKYIVDKYHKDKALSEMTPDELKAYNKEQATKNAKKKKKKKKPSQKKKKSNSKKKKPQPKKPADKTADKDKEPEEEEEGPKPKNYFLKHKPVRFDAMLWLAKSYLELENYDDAGRYLRLLIEKSDVPKRIKADAHTVLAYSYIKQKEYTKAIEELETGIDMIRRKKKKTRFIYVLAQLYQKTGNNQLAMENFRKIPRSNPPYEMEFNARLNMAVNAAGAENAKINPETTLKRMLRDGKNEEYKDQIYFALAQIQFKQGNKENGILALQLAMQGSDDFQRTEISYMLAELFYEKKDYVKAYSYYDTCSNAIQKADERSAYVSSQKLLLKQLAENINIVTLKDSLVGIASWSFDKQKELVQRLRLEEEAAKKPQNALDRNASKNKAAADAGINTSAVNASKFPLYDPNNTKKGEKDFQKRWGNREWADNWRRSEGDMSRKDNRTAENEGLKPLTEQETKDYLKKMGVPQDSVSIVKMNKEIENALYLIGANYYEKLDENKRAEASINQLFSRFPKTAYELEAWFLLFNICTEDKNTACANSNKEKITAKYGDTDIAKSLKDPNFLNTKQRQIAEVNKYYEDTYNLIRSGQFADASKRIEELPKKYGVNYPLKPRFAILSAMCVGGLQGVDEYIKSLKSVSVSYPNTDEDKKAKEMVALLSGSKVDNKNPNPQPVKSDGDGNKSKYPFDNEANTGHYILIAFDDVKANINELKIKITEFNSKTYSLLRLNVSSLMLDGKTPTLIVRKFKDRKEAQDYLNTAEGNSEFMGKDAPAHKIYFIGQNNYRDVLQKQNFGEYVKFYEEMYN